MKYILFSINMKYLGLDVFVVKISGAIFCTFLNVNSTFNFNGSARGESLHLENFKVILFGLC